MAGIYRNIQQQEETDFSSNPEFGEIQLVPIVHGGYPGQDEDPFNMKAVVRYCSVATKSTLLPRSIVSAIDYVSTYNCQLYFEVFDGFRFYSVRVVG